MGKIVNALNDMPGDYMNMLFSIGANVCNMTFNKPHFSEVHESRINENTETFSLPINLLAATISCTVINSS